MEGAIALLGGMAVLGALSLKVIFALHSIVGTTEFTLECTKEPKESASDRDVPAWAGFKGRVGHEGKENRIGLTNMEISCVRR